MTYRLDSDIPRPYGWIEDKESGSHDHTLNPWPPFDQRAFLASLPNRPQEFKDLALKPKLVAWIVSNCNSRSSREAYVRELRKHVPVDIMGGCGDLACDVGHRSKSDNCTAAVNGSYKFYLSFENSLCDGYATEKFWWRMSQPVVPVVMGRGRYAEVAPPHSHLNVEDYDSPKALAEHLLYLDQNPAEYLSYFWWRDRYRAVNSVAQKAASMCRLCQMLNDPDEPEKVVSDLEDWWWKKSKCVAKGKAPWANVWTRLSQWIPVGGSNKIRRETFENNMPV